MSDDFHERTNIRLLVAMDRAMGLGYCTWFWVVMYDDSWFGTTTDKLPELWCVCGSRYFSLGFSQWLPGFLLKSKSTKNDVVFLTL